jgi:multicomponent Na+:H+ antiporter subunit F
MDYSFMLLAAATTGLLVAMLITLARTIAGPSLYDRVLAVNSVGTKIVLLIAAMGFLAGRPDFLDIALLYALVNFIGTLAVLKFFRYRHLGIAGSADDGTAAGETGGRR